MFSPSQRSAEDLEVIYEELLHVKAAAHLSASVSHYNCLHISLLMIKELDLIHFFNLNTDPL